MHAEGKPRSGPVVIDKAKRFCDEMKITNKCAFPGGWLQNVNPVVPN
jgi:hypothetical protein